MDVIDKFEWVFSKESNQLEFDFESHAVFTLCFLNKLIQRVSANRSL